jgi:hypothetical protein
VQEKACFAYSLHGAANELQRWADRLGQHLAHWVADASQLTMGHGIPQDWKEQGAIFGADGELRWWKDGQQYRAVLLTEQPLPELQPIAGSWTTDERPFNFFLQDLRAAHLRPNFIGYPHGSHKGYLRAKLYRRNGVMAFVSLRALEGGHDAT